MRSILTYRLGKTATPVQEAARRAEFSTRAWSGRADWSSAEAPSFVVAGIGRGERRIPPDLVDVVTRVLPGAPLLLVCEEELVSPTASLHRGRVTLLGPPLSNARLYSEMRVLLTRSLGRPLVRELATGGRARERSGRGHWAAQLTGHPTEDRMTFVVEADDCLTAVVALEGLVTRADASRATSIIERGADDDEVTGELRNVLGTRGGIVHFDAHAQSWLLYWPSETAAVFVHSPFRLPNLFRPLRRASEETALTRLPVCDSDVCVALTAPLAEGTLTSLTQDLRGGGPSTLDALARRETSTGRRPSGIVVEARA